MWDDAALFVADVADHADVVPVGGLSEGGLKFLIQPGGRSVMTSGLAPPGVPCRAD